VNFLSFRFLAISVAMAPISPSAATNGTNGTCHTTNGVHPSKNGNKPTILHLGDPIHYNLEFYSDLDSKYTITRPSISELDRPQFIQHLKDKTWGDFSAIMRPFWNTGAEMGKWDRELIELLPKSMKVMASAGAGFDWVDTETLGEHGELFGNTVIQQRDADTAMQASSMPTVLEPQRNPSPTWLYFSLSRSFAK